jgi:hypothetical protein
MPTGMVTEKTFQKTVVSRAKKLAAQRGKFLFIAKMEAVGQRGFPDLLLISGGVSLYLELKSPKGTGVLSPLQVRMHQDLVAAGAWVEVGSNLEFIDSLLEKLLG